jgi:hypothetical protein
MFMAVTNWNAASSSIVKSMITAYLLVQPDGECCTNEVRLFKN